MKELMEEYGQAILAAMGSIAGLGILGAILYRPGCLLALYAAKWLELL